MNSTREKLKKIRKAIKDANRIPLNLIGSKEIILTWLSQFNFPFHSDNSTWEESLEYFPDPSPDCKRPKEGLKIRFLLKLSTAKHRYIITIVECFDEDAQGIGIISVHANMDRVEYLAQKTIELSYKLTYDNSLKASQTIFVEPFNIDTLLESLNCMGLAILGNELTGETIDNKGKEIIQILPQQVISFPESESETEQNLD